MNDHDMWSKYILLDVLVCSIVEYFFELRRILTSLKSESKYKQRVKIYSAKLQQKKNIQTSHKSFIIQLLFFSAKSFCSFLIRREKQSW